MKITRTTIKSFIKKNKENLFINVKSSFDGMTDCCESQHDGFQKVIQTTDHYDHTLGVLGAWFVGQSRDYFYPYNENGFVGYEISNCCGNFIIAINKKN